MKKIHPSLASPLKSLCRVADGVGECPECGETMMTFAREDDDDVTLLTVTQHLYNTHGQDRFTFWLVEVKEWLRNEDPL